MRSAKIWTNPWRASADPQLFSERLPLAVDQRFVKPAGRLHREYAGQNLERGGIFVRTGGDMVGGVHDADLAHATQDDVALAILRRFVGIGGVELSLRPGDGAEYKDVRRPPELAAR